MSKSIFIPLSMDSMLEVNFKGPVNEQYRLECIDAISRAIHLTNQSETMRLMNGSFTGITGMINILFDPNLPPKSAYLVSQVSPELLQQLKRRPSQLEAMPNHLLEELRSKIIHIIGLPEEKGND